MILAAAFKGLIGAMETPEATSLGLGGLLAALLGAPFLIWSTVLKDRTVRFQKEGHMTDRISKAVEQLGAEKTVKRDGKEWSEPNLEVRIGAILSLERIARDSTGHDRGRDHVRVMEILCAYIRHNAPASAAQDHPFGDWEPLPDDPTPEERLAHEARREERFRGDGQVRAWAQTLGPPRADIAEALKVLGRRSREQMLVEAAWPHPRVTTTAWPFDNAPQLAAEYENSPVASVVLEAFKDRLYNWKRTIQAFSSFRLNLSETNLQGANLSGYRFQGAVLEGARFEGANLSNALMQGARLMKARLDGANLHRANLAGAFLKEGRLEGATLQSAKLQGAVLWQARMDGAFLWLAHLSFAQLQEVGLEKASLTAARLEHANLKNARMQRAVLHEARLEGADLSAARFDARTSLQGAVFSEASWRDVDLSMLALSQDQINSTFGDASVTLPKGLTRPAHWPVWRLHDHDPSGGPTFNSERNRWRSNPSTYTPPPPPA